MKGLEKNTVAVIIIAAVIIVFVGFLYALNPHMPIKNSNNTSKTNNSTLLNKATDNSTVINNNINNTTVNGSKFYEQTKNENPPPTPHEISAEEARELAKKYVGPDTVLGKPVKTTYKRIHAWQVPVYTRQHEFINNIYISVRTGKKVD